MRDMRTLALAVLLIPSLVRASEFTTLLDKTRVETDANAKIAAFEKAIAAWKKSDGSEALGKAHVQLGTLHFGLNRYYDAIGHAGKAVDAAPNDSIAWNLRGLAYMKLHRYDPAVADLEKASQLSPQDVTIKSNLCAAAVRARTPERAAAACDAAEHTGQLLPMTNYAYYLIETGKAKEALEACAAADKAGRKMRLTAGSFEGAVEACRGAAYAKLGQHKKAIKEFDAVLKRDPRSPDALWRRGDAHAQAGDAKKARADYDRALELDRDFIEAYESRAKLAEKAGKKDEALRDYSEACKRVWPSACEAEKKLKG